jgi:hypothetical protein
MIIILQMILFYLMLLIKRREIFIENHVSGNLEPSHDETEKDERVDKTQEEEVPVRRSSQKLNPQQD